MTTKKDLQFHIDYILAELERTEDAYDRQELEQELDELRLQLTELDQDN